MINVNRKLYDYIYNDMGAEYYQNYKDVMINVDNDNEKNLKYLGTYFPRSFKEAYTIYDNIFSNGYIYNEFSSKHIINILDIGSGTGGNLIGLLQILCEKFNNKEINIISVDGNKNALELQKKLIDNIKDFVNLNGNRIRYKFHIMKFENKDEIELKLKKIMSSSSMDIIHSFKFLNELYNMDYDKNKGSYKNILKLGELYLKNNGLLCLVDVTSKVNNREFMSIIINKECREYLKENTSNLNYIIPLCCALNYNECVRPNSCFSRYQINTRYELWNDLSKISYKLFIKDPLGNLVLDEIYKDCCDEIGSCHCLDSTIDNNCTKLKDQPYCL